MNSEWKKADILFNYGLPLQFFCHLIQFYTVFESSHCYFNAFLVLTNELLSYASLKDIHVSNSVVRGLIRTSTKSELALLVDLDRSLPMLDLLVLGIVSIEVKPPVFRDAEYGQNPQNLE